MNEVIEEENRTFNQIMLYGQDTTGTEVVASAKQYPFGSDRLLVIVKEAKSLKEFDAVINPRHHLFLHKGKVHKDRRRPGSVGGDPPPELCHYRCGPQGGQGLRPAPV